MNEKVSAFRKMLLGVEMEKKEFAEVDEVSVSSNFPSSSLTQRQNQGILKGEVSLYH